MQYPKPKEGVSFWGFLSHMRAFGVESNQCEQPVSLHRSCCNLSRCLLEQVKLVLEQVFPGEEEGFLCSCSYCVQFLYWLPVFKSRWLPRSSSFTGYCEGGLCPGWWEGLLFKQTNVTRCCSIIALTKGTLPRLICVSVPIQISLLGGVWGLLCTSVLFSLCTIDISVSTATSSSTMFPAEGWMNPWKCAQHLESMLQRPAAFLRLPMKPKALKSGVCVPFEQLEWSCVAWE